MFVTAIVAPMVIGLLALPGGGLMAIGEKLRGRAEPEDDWE
jgi:hypothetical protein